jgi:enoyl-CoA hydratase/carnithine racemase
MTTAHRYGGADALAAAIVDLAVGAEEVRGSAMQIAGAHAGKAGSTLATIKARLYANALDALRDADNPLG